jgi:hypothetical protein
VLTTIDLEGWTDQQPGAVAALIERTAATLGTSYQSPAELAGPAEQAVDEVQARVAGMNQSGGLKQINRQYKAYRVAQIAKAERAMPYSKFIERFTATIVRDVAGDLTRALLKRYARR